MTARYLLRLDDACPTRHRDRWQRLEALFERWGIRPIVAVVPENADPELAVESADPGFWDRVRAWQSKGWTIAMHGERHVYHPVDKRRLLVPFHDRSEFAGLPYAEQAEKLRRAWALFAGQGVGPTLWVAPGHSFDQVTLEALRNETPIRTINDGIARNPFLEGGFYWLPQQLWALARRRSGLWTVCLHPNTMSDEAFAALAVRVADPWFRQRIVSVGELALVPRERDLWDWAYARYFWSKGPIVQALLRVRDSFRRRLIKP